MRNTTKKSGTHAALESDERTGPQFSLQHDYSQAVWNPGSKKNLGTEFWAAVPAPKQTSPGADYSSSKFREKRFEFAGVYSEGV
jgi:hypothetical protein